MINHTEFIKRYYYEVSSKACRGVPAALKEFDTVQHFVTKDHGDIENIAEIREMFVHALSMKPNWGCNELKSIMNTTLREFR